MAKESDRVRSFKCPHCGKIVLGAIVDSRPIPYGRIRRRFCEQCYTRFTTVERVEEENKDGDTTGGNH